MFPASPPATSHDLPRGGPITAPALRRLALAALAAFTFFSARAATPLIMPLPQEIEATGGVLLLDDSVRVLVPLEPSAADMMTAREITAELTGRYGIAPQLARVPRVPETGRAIVIGRFDNPLVRQLCAARRISVDATSPGPEGYALQVDDRIALVAGSDERGAFYGLQSLRQLISRSAGKIAAQGVRVRDWPHKPFRGIRLYLPGPENMAFFKRFVRDFMALNKYNQLIVEMNAAMRLDQHPELNAGWLDLGHSLISTRRNRSFGPKGEEQDSVHHDTADGAILEKRDVADLVAFAREYHIDVVPEIPSLSHAYYLLTRRRDIAEMPDAEWPDAYCPSNPESHAVLFDVLQEYIEVMQPKIVHIGHDEWRIRIGACPRCRDHDTRELYAADVKKIHRWLANRGVGTMIWGDHLIERLRGKVAYDVKTPGGFAYKRPGGLTAEMVVEHIPKDILVANWMWQEPYPGQGEVNDLDLAKWGFRQFYGNLEPQIQNWGRRSVNPSVIGGAASSWVASTEYTFGKDQVFDLITVGNLLWSSHWPSLEEMTATVQAFMPHVRERLTGRRSFTTFGDPQRAVTLPGATRSSDPKKATAQSGLVTFQFDPAATPLNATSGEAAPSVAVDADASSLIFLHAAQKPAANELSYRTIHNVEDTADLIGHYEVLYADGFVVTIPIRYGVHALEHKWTPAARPRTYCYLADPVECGPGQTFFAYEWHNPRLGKPIKSVTLKASSGFVNARGAPAAENEVLLKALTIVEPRPFSSAKPFTTED